MMIAQQSAGFDIAELPSTKQIYGGTGKGCRLLVCDGGKVRACRDWVDRRELHVNTSMA